MQTTANPYPSLSESLATTGAGEIQRLRYQIQNLFGLTYWFRNDENINFSHAGGLTVVQGSGSGRHVTAVGYHSWAGSARFPAIAGRYVHTTGLFWPAAHHLAVAVDPAIDRDRTGIETFRFHAQALTLHHTAALRFTHSLAFAAPWQYPHITAVQVTQSQRGPDGSQPPGQATGYDQLAFGHASAVMTLVGYGASHIALGSRAYVALGRHVGTLAGATPVANALYADLITKGWGSIGVAGASAQINGAFNVSSATRIDTGDFRVFWDRDFADGNYAVVVNPQGNGALRASIEAVNAAHVAIRTWDASGAPTDTSFSFFAVGSQ